MYKPFKPAFGLKNRHAQTLYSTFFAKHKKPDIKVEKFELSDGDFLDCYWHNKPKNTMPIVILFHGLAGSFNSPYIHSVMNSLEASGFCSVLMHFRGCSGRENRLSRSYHSGDTGDAKECIKYLQDKYPDSPLFAVGYSLGGNMLLKMLGEFKNSSPFRGAVSISAPMQLDVCANQMDRGFSKFYQRHLMKDLKLSLLQKYQKHNMKSYIGIDELDVEKLKTFWEFDDVYTAPIHGFRSAQDYYTKSSSKQYLKYIQTDTLIIHSLDDPFMTPEILPSDEELSKKIKLELYPHGGHVGFISGTIINPEFWLGGRIVSYLSHFLKS